MDQYDIYSLEPRLMVIDGMSKLSRLRWMKQEELGSTIQGALHRYSRVEYRRTETDGLWRGLLASQRKSYSAE